MSLSEQNTSMDPASLSADLRSLEVPDDKGRNRDQVHLFFSKTLGEYVEIPTPSLPGPEQKSFRIRTVPHISELKNRPPGPKKRPCRCCLYRQGSGKVDSREEYISNSKCHNGPSSRGTLDVDQSKGYTSKCPDGPNSRGTKDDEPSSLR